MYVYNRLMVTGHASLVQQAIKGFPPTPETSNMKRPMPCKTEIKTENRNRTSSSPKPSPESVPKPRTNRRVYFLEKAARARKTASLSANDANDRNITTKSSPTSTPTKCASYEHPISTKSLDTIVEMHAQTNKEAHQTPKLLHRPTQKANPTQWAISSTSATTPATTFYNPKTKQKSKFRLLPPSP